MIDRSQRIADAYCRRVAEQLRRDPEAVLAKARINLERMRPHCHPDLVAQWHRALTLPPEQLAAVLTAPEGAELRRNSPFAGVLDERMRQRILESVQREAGRA